MALKRIRTAQLKCTVLRISLLRFSIGAALCTLLYLGWTTWRPDGWHWPWTQRSLATLDAEALRANFAKLKQAVSKHSGPYKDLLDQMMTRFLPEVSTTDWELHSPSGDRSFTVEQVQALALVSRGNGSLVPNVAHFVMPFGDTNLQFHNMVSILSCLHVMKPHRLLLWYAPGRLPTGEWWDRVRKNLTESEWEEKVIMVRRSIPTSVYTVSVLRKEHQSDVIRLEAVLIFGGIYLDTDVFVLKPLEPLRKFACTLGREVPDGLCNGVIFAAPYSTFLAMWHTAYQVFYDKSWGDHSVLLPNTMQPMFPDLCHVEEDSLNKPTWKKEERIWIYGIGQQHMWDWRRKNYVMHMWFRKYGQQQDLESIKTLNSNYGEICRFLLFGTP